MTGKIRIDVDKRVMLGMLFVVIAVAAFLVFKKDVSASPIQEAYDALKSPTAKKLFYDQSDGLTKEVPARLVELDEKTIGCFGASQVMSMSENDPNLGGQCCGALKNEEQYLAQLEVLSDFIERHGSVDLIPKDPYDVSVSLAKQLTSLDQTVVLTREQQDVYDKAVSLSHHGGPCCCKCWKWYVMSGLGKKLIVEHGFSSEELAELWDLSSSCGHEEDTNMYQHYGKDDSQGELGVNHAH